MHGTHQGQAGIPIIRSAISARPGWDKHAVASAWTNLSTWLSASLCSCGWENCTSYPPQNLLVECTGSTDTREQRGVPDAIDNLSKTHRDRREAEAIRSCFLGGKAVVSRSHKACCPDSQEMQNRHHVATESREAYLMRSTISARPHWDRRAVASAWTSSATWRSASKCSCRMRP